MTAPQCVRVEAGVQCPLEAVGVVAVAFFPFESMMGFRCPTCDVRHHRQQLLERRGAVLCPTCLLTGGPLEPIPVRRLVLGIPHCASHQQDARLEDLMLPSSLTTMVQFIERQMTLTIDPKGIKVVPVPFTDPDYQKLEEIRRDTRVDRTATVGRWLPLGAAAGDTMDETSKQQERKRESRAAAQEASGSGQANQAAGYIDKPFAYHKPSDDGMARINAVRAGYSLLKRVLEQNCPPSRHLAVAITELETSAMWAIKAVVFNDPASVADTLGLPSAVSGTGALGLNDRRPEADTNAPDRTTT